MRTQPTLTLVITLLALGGSAWAKLPAPTDEAKAKAAEAAAKTAYTGKVGNYQLCMAMDRVAAGYQAALKKAGKTPPSPTDTAACSAPEPFAYAPAAAAKPIEAAGAHSPAATAAAPPSTTAPAAALQPRK